MFKETYNSMYDQVSPSDHLVSDTISYQRTKRKASKRFVPLYRKPAFVSIVLVLFLSLSLPALAASIPATYELMYYVSPSVAQFFKPVRKSCENNGIKMEVLSAYIHDDTAEIYVALQDLTGNRVDATTDLFDSYSIHRPFDSSATCRRVGFDKTTNTATFLISITEQGNKKITGGKITFSVREFISGKQIYNGVPVTVDMSGVSDNPITMPMPDEYGYGGGGYDFPNNGIPTVLTPSVYMNFGIEGVDISGMGYIDGMFHIQTVVRNNLKNDNHGYFYFKTVDGGEVNCIYNIAFNEYENGERLSYNEMVFNIPQSKLDQYEVFGNFVTSSIHTDGYWQVTFPLE